jgi:hypothetical protein
VAAVLPAESAVCRARFHPNIAPFWDFGDDNETPFLAMEYVDGRSTR